MKEGFVPTEINGEVNVKPVHASLKFNNRQITFNQGTSYANEEQHYMYTDKGISFYLAVSLNGILVQGLDYNEDNDELTGQSIDGKTDIKLQGKVPNDYFKFGDFAGSDTLVYDKENKTIDVELVADKEKPIYSFVTNDYGYFVINSFALWKITAAGGKGGQVTDESWYINGEFGMKNLVSLIKKIK